MIEILRVEGMRGERDRRAVVEAVLAVPGVRRAFVNLADRSLRIERDREAGLAAIIQAVKDAGYEVSVLV